jgi:hypothetical protein
MGSFDPMEFEYQRNTMQGTFDFVSLETRLHKIKEQLVRFFKCIFFYFFLIVPFSVLDCRPSVGPY